MTVLGCIVFLIVAAVFGGIAQLLMPGRIPGGFRIAAAIGLLGAWFGGNFLGNYGPSLVGVSLLPVIQGSVVFVFTVAFLSWTLRDAKVRQ